MELLLDENACLLYSAGDPDGVVDQVCAAVALVVNSDHSCTVSVVAKKQFIPYIARLPSIEELIAGPAGKMSLERCAMF